MGKAYHGGYQDTFGFTRESNKPIDDSDIVEFIADLTNGTVNKPYPLMEVGVLENLKYYSWNGSDISLLANWIPRSEGGSGNAAITSNGTIPALVDPITGAQIRTLIGAGIGSMNTWILGVDGTLIGSVGQSDIVNLQGSSTINLAITTSSSTKTIIISLPSSFTVDGVITANAGFISNSGFVVNHAPGQSLIMKTSAPVGGSYMDWNDAAGRKGFFGFAATVNEHIYLVNEEAGGEIRIGTQGGERIIILASGAVTIEGRAFALTGSANTIPYRDPNGILVATGVAISGGSNPLFVLRGDGSVSSITKAEIDNLGVNAGLLSGRILNFAPVGNTVAGRDTDGSLSALLFNLVRAPETTRPLDSFTVTLAAPGSNNYHSLRNVPKYLFKEYLYESTNTSFAQLPTTASIILSTLEFRRKDGRVLIKGTFTGDSTGSNITIANLPSGSRPLVEEFTSVQRALTEMIPVRINTGGAILLGQQVTGTSYSVSIECIIDKSL
jgi:hypothetical protein